MVKQIIEPFVGSLLFQAEVRNSVVKERFHLSFGERRHVLRLYTASFRPRQLGEERVSFLIKDLSEGRGWVLSACC